MSPFNLIPTQYKALAIGIALVVFMVGAFGAGWTTNGWRLNKVAAEKEARHAQEVIALQDAARMKEQEWNKKLEDSRNEAAKREISLRADADLSRQSVISLRDQLAANKRAMSNAAADALRQYADSLSNVLSDCTDKYRSLAEDADRHASDVQTLIDAWPK